jgi:hypothetical protein
MIVTEFIFGYVKTLVLATQDKHLCINYYFSGSTQVKILP